MLDLNFVLVVAGSTAVIVVSLYALYRAVVRIRVLEGEVADLEKAIADRP